MAAVDFNMQLLSLERHVDEKNAGLASSMSELGPIKETSYLSACSS